MYVPLCPSILCDAELKIIQQYVHCINWLISVWIKLKFIHRYISHISLCSYNCSSLRRQYFSQSVTSTHTYSANLSKHFSFFQPYNVCVWCVLHRWPAFALFVATVWHGKVRVCLPSFLMYCTCQHRPFHAKNAFFLPRSRWRLRWCDLRILFLTRL